MSINREVINDTAKLIMHRLIARRVATTPSIIAAARNANAKAAEHFPGQAFVGEWDAILALSPQEIGARLICKSSAMTRLRTASPFIGTKLGLTDYDFRIRIGRAAKRVVARRMSRSRKATAEAS